MRNCQKCPKNPIKYKGDGIHYTTCGHDLGTDDLQLPQPHFIPGYAGYTPGSGPQRLFITADSYGRYTHQLLHGHRVGGGRMNPLCSDMRFVNQFVSPPRQNPKEALDNPHKSLDPYFIPGYTGFTPGSGIRRVDAIGENYGLMTHLRLAKHPVAGSRLRPIYNEPPEYIANAEEVKFYCNKHELTANDLKRRSGQVPGYAGYMPRALFYHGKTGTKIGNISIADFEKIMENKKPLSDYQNVNM